MSDPLIITAVMRFEALRRQFRSMACSRRKKISNKQRHHIAQAASLQQIAEVAILERALGAKHDRQFVERLKVEVKQHLILAGAKPGESKR